MVLSILAWGRASSNLNLCVSKKKECVLKPLKTPTGDSATIGSLLPCQKIPKSLSDEADMLAALAAEFHRFGTQAMPWFMAGPLKHQKLHLSFSSDFCKKKLKRPLKGILLA